jgi:DNA-binding NarL/FixJ family response regulator
VRKVRTLLADDHPMVFEMVERLLKPACRIVAKVGDGQALIQAAFRTKPAVIITDISMPVLNGIEAAQRLRHSGSVSRIVFLTVHEDEDFIKACFDAGALAYVSKLRMNTDLWPAIQEALMGHRFVSPMTHSTAV